MKSCLAFPPALLLLGSRRILPLWTLAALVIFLMQIAVSAVVHDNENVRAFLRFLEILPPFIKTALGGETLSLGNTSGLIAIGYQHPLVLFLFLLYAVGAPTMLLTREIQNGTMELILSRAVTKAQVYACAALLTLAGLFVLALVMFGGTSLASQLFEFKDPVPLDRFFRIATTGGVLAATCGGIALLSAGAFPGRNAALAFPVAFLICNYFVWILAQWWPPAAWLKPATLFYYVLGADLFAGWPLRNIGILASILAVTTLTGGLFWRRRDLPL